MIEDEMLNQIIKRNGEIKEMVEPFFNMVMNAFVENFGDLNNTDFETAQTYFENQFSLKMHEINKERHNKIKEQTK